MSKSTKGKIQKSEQIVMKDAISKFEIVGKIVEEGKLRGFEIENTIQLICAGIIKI